MSNTVVNSRVEDALTYLSRKPLQEFSKGTIIYGLDQPSANLCLVVSGRVKVSTVADDGCQTVLRIVPPEGLFGYAAMLGQEARPEQAWAIERVHLMCWSAEEIERQIEREPKLGLALAQDVVSICLELQDRIESMAFHKTPERVTIAMLQLAGGLGQPTPDGMTRVPGLTHHTIAEFVGTSREIVTSQMNRLRRQGMLRYTRRYIDINVGALEEALRMRGVAAPTRGMAPEKVRHAGGG